MDTFLLAELLTLPQEFPGLEKLSDNAVRLLGTGKFTQFCATLRAMLDPEAFCPFCKYEPERDLAKDLKLRWWLRGNTFQKEQTGHMSLIVPRRHLTKTVDMEENDWEQISLLFQCAVIRFKLSGGGLVMRFGDPRYSAGTIEHLHVNVISPESPEKEFRFPLSKNREDRVENYTRLLRHRDELAQKGGGSWLLSPEGIAATPG